MACLVEMENRFWLLVGLLQLKDMDSQVCGCFVGTARATLCNRPKLPVVCKQKTKTKHLEWLVDALNWAQASESKHRIPFKFDTSSQNWLEDMNFLAPRLTWSQQFSFSDIVSKDSITFHFEHLFLIVSKWQVSLIRHHSSTTFSLHCSK